MLSLAFAVVLLGTMFFACGDSAPTPAPSGPPKVSADRVEIVMFHRTVR
jgi:hypothetical protein